jgi:predicted N-acetyltransferase YhbS
MIEQVLDRAFGTDRHARTAYRVREGMEWLPAISFAALDEDDLLVGTIQAWPVGLFDDDKRGHPMIMTGPVAVVPERQEEGFGKALMMAHLSALGDNALPQVLIGDPEYYGRFFGFSAVPTRNWRVSGPYDPDRLLCRAPNPAVLPRSGMLGPWSGPLTRPAADEETAR